MNKIWRNKVVQFGMLIFIVSSFGIVLNKLSTLQLIIEHANTMIDEEVTINLIKDIKIIEIIVIIIWSSLIGLYSNFTYSINQNKN